MKTYSVLLAIGSLALAGAAGAGTPAMEKDVVIKSAWKPGDYDWPSAYPKGLETDWSGYDRLVLDVTNLADDGDVITFVLKSPETPKNDGKLSYLRAPAWETVRWEIPLVYFEDGKASVTNVTKFHIHSHRPKHLNATFSNFRLLKAGEEAPAVQTPPALVAELRKGRLDYERRMREKRAAFVKELKAANERDGVRNAKMLYGVGSAMAQVRPKTTYSLRSAAAVKVRLARNEWEGRQIFVTPVEGTLRDVSVSVSPLVNGDGARLPPDAVKVSVLGYVKTVRPPRYGIGYNEPTNAAPGYVRKVKKADLGWWPDILLDFMERTDVADGDVQGFWISVHAAEHQAAGVYEGRVRIAAANAAPIELPFSVRVNDFTLPKTPVIPTLVSFSPGAHVAPDRTQEHKDLAASYKADPESPINQWSKHRLEWGDFLADHFITMQKLYQHADADICYDVYDRLLEQGRMGGYNLFYFSSQKVSDSWETWMGWVESEIARRLDKAAARGLGDHCFVYCCDETPVSRFDEIEPIMRRLRTKFPSLRILSTCQDRSYGLDSGLGDITGFIPTTDRYDPAQAALSRAAGHEVWWYYACDEKAPYPNVFTECQPIEQRLLMGAMAAKYRPDGFLYYQMAYFNSENCITGGPYTDWNPRSWYREHGDATWVAVGPGGMPLSTIRFENFRDGLEDLWYAELLRAKLAEKPDAAWAGRARALLEVPRSVVDSLTNYTDRAEALLAWRDGIADLLEGGSYTIHGGDVTTLTNVLAIGETWKTYRLEPGVFDLASLTNAPMSLSPTWWGPSLLSVPNGSTFVGTGDGPEEVVLKGPGVHRLMCVSGNCTIRNLTFEGGNALTGGANAKYCSGGALVTSGSAPTVTNCVFRGNCAKYGGAVNGITARDCLFTGNWTEGYGFGGAGYLGRYYGCTIVSNAATDVWANGGGLSGATVVDGCTVVSNVAAYGGGGLGECRGVVNTRVAFNAAVGPNNARGGGLYSCGTITNCTVACNMASGYAHGMVDTSAVGSSFRFNGSSHHSRNSSDYVARFEDCDLVGSAVESASLERCRVHHVSNAVAVADNVHYGPSVRTLVYPFENCTHLRNVLIDGCWITNWSNHACFYTSGRSLSVENCTIVSNSFTYTLRGYNGDRTADFVNTVFCGNRRGSEEVDFRGYESPNVNFVNSIVGLARPRFVGTEPHPYSPQRRSPLVGKGAVADWMRTATDLAGNPMLKSEDATSVDVGCYQCWLEAPGALLFLR